MAFLKSDEDAKDAMQDTFFNLWRSGEVETEPEARNKLFKILKNICIDRLRKSRAIGIVDINNTDLVEEPLQYEDMNSYESLLTSGLTDIQRRIYSLVIHEGMEYDAIANVLNMSVESVRMNMSRARKKIRDNYKHLDK